MWKLRWVWGCEAAAVAAGLSPVPTGSWEPSPCSGDVGAPGFYILSRDIYVLPEHHTRDCLAILPTQLFAGECAMGWPASEDPSLRSSSYSLPLAWTAEAMSSLPGDQPDPITTRSPLFPFNS